VGYDLHITRRKNWSEAGNDITAEEWLAYVAKDPELSLSPENGPQFALWSGKSKHADPWLDWFNGNIYAKNPDEVLIDKMVAIGRSLNAQVQGDDGEIYRSAHEPPIPPQMSALDRFENWFRTPRSPSLIKQVTPPFQVGDRVLDAYRKEATVIELDPKTNHGLGSVKVRYDDGRELSFALAASGLTPVPRAENQN
jgi:hypothetical protein